MKTIGMVGGISWVSTVEYYTHLNQMVRETLGGNHSAKCHLVSLEFGEICENNLRSDHEANYRLILGAAKHLEATGCDLLVLCANTMHMHADRIRAEVSTELIHVAEVTSAEAKRLGIGTVALLGTQYVMEGEFYIQKIEEAGLKVITPPKHDRAYIHNAIFNELTRSQFLPSTRARFKQIIGELHKEGAEGVILGCTELPLLVQQEDTPLPLLDTTKLHASAAVKRALQ